MDPHTLSVAGLYILQLSIVYKLGRLESRLRSFEQSMKPVRVR